MFPPHLPTPTRFAESRRLVAFAGLAAVCAIALPAHAAPILHERIPDDAEIDLALGAVVAGEIPAVVETPAGFIGAPDPRKPPSPTESAYASGKGTSLPGVQPDASFVPDRDTRRPDTLPYDDPFKPSTAPFKRLVAFDAVRADFSLSVNQPQLRVIPRTSSTDSADDRFYADIVVDAQPGQPVRIPTVGPDARVLHATLWAGPKEVKFRLLRDDADNWFVDATQQARARLVMDLAIRRATFGGELGRASWAELAKPAPLPPNVAASAKIVLDRIGVSRELEPREAIKKLVAYFRAFHDSEEVPKAGRDVYLDLALSQKGVCRHRAFAFLITALGVGIPTRMVMNEAHAWVEVNDGRLWRRIDLGGAGRMLSNPLAQGPIHESPADPFGWPPNATRGEDIAGIPRPSNGAGGAGNGRSGSRTAGAGSAGGHNPSAPGSAGAASSSDPSGAGTVSGAKSTSDKDARPTSNVELVVENPVARRGAAVQVHGTVSAGKDRCANVTVDIVFREATSQHEVRVGTLATDERGNFAGSVVIPPVLSVGDYDLLATTEGDQLRCGASQ